MESSHETLRDTVISESKIVHSEIDARDLNRVLLYLSIGITGIVVSAFLPQDSVWQQTSIGIYTASTVFSLHELLHYRIHQLPDRIPWDITYLKESDYKTYSIEVVIVVVDIIVALPMFAYGRTSIRYTIYVAIVFTVCGGFWLIAWFFYNRVGQTQEIDLSTGAEITLWNHTIRTTVSMSIMMLGVLVLVPIFASAQFGIDFLILLVSLVPSVFVSISHYNFMIFLLSRLFIEYISILLKITSQTYAIFTCSSVLMIWIVILWNFYNNPMAYFGDTLQYLVMMSIILSWSSIGVIFSLPYLISAWEWLSLSNI